MKRISIGIILCALAPSLCQAYHSHSQRYQIRYSPYAFNYRHSGLIPAGVRFSPYAYTPSSSGLVYEGTRFTPYAFTYKNSGLIVDSYWQPVPACPPCPACTSCPQAACRPCGADDNACTTARSAQARPAPAPQARRHGLARRHPAVRTTDGMDIIRQYLKGRGIENVSISRMLRIDNKMVGVDFVVRDKNLMITYWSPDEIESLGAKAAYKQKAFANYQEKSQRLTAAFEANGGVIHQVNASDPKAIVAALQALDILAPDTDSQRPTNLYAKE